MGLGRSVIQCEIIQAVMPPWLRENVVRRAVAITCPLPGSGYRFLSGHDDGYMLFSLSALQLHVPCLPSPTLTMFIYEFL